MAKLYGEEISRENLLRRVGNISQVAGVKSYELCHGREEGVKAFEVTTGGLDFTVLESKCLDIASAKYKGINLNFMSKPGIASQSFSSEFQRSFQAGLLYTCGLRNVGSPCIVDGESHGIHGRIGQTPAENVGMNCRWEDDEYVMEITGEMHEAALFGENLVLRRKITTSLGAKHFTIEDQVENLGFNEQYLMLLYHINLGYPLLDKDARFISPSVEVVPRDDEARAGAEEYNTFIEPKDVYAEKVYYHKVSADDQGYSYAAIINEKLKLGFYVRYDSRQLKKLIQWKSMASGDYALGIEPANCLVEGRKVEMQRDSGEYIAPLGKMKFELELGVLDGIDEIREFEEKIKGI